MTGGGPFSRRHLYCLLANPIYIGKLSHSGKLHDGKPRLLSDNEPIYISGDPTEWLDDRSMEHV